MNANLRNFALWVIIVLLLLALFTLFQNPGQRTTSQDISFSQLLNEVDQGRVRDVLIQGPEIHGTYTDGRSFQTYAPSDPSLVQRLYNKGVQITARPQSDNVPWFVSLLISWLPFVALIGVWIFLSRQMQGAGGKALGFGKSRAKLLTEAHGRVTFEDVAGVDEAKLDLQEIVEFLRDPAKFQRLGGRIPRGVLLVGPPGTGKTLLARAIAGEANVPFFTISGSDFVEMFVGVGAARVRDLFEQARKAAPCIIFIDELDALGRSRGPGAFGGYDEKEQTLNQLLAELDGFDPTMGVILLGATNRPEVLDPALLRPGRFDRQVLVDRPDRSGRLEILKVHVARIRLAPGVDLDQIAGLTTGFTGADLANLVNEAAIVATRRSAEAVMLADFTAAIERLVAGLEKKSRVLGQEERRLVAYHEMGHALVAASLPGVDPVHKVSIIPRGIGALGYTMQRPTEDRFVLARHDLANRIAVLMGGRASEALIFDGEVSTGAADDLQRATEIALQMVTRFGMDETVGQRTYSAPPQPFLGTSTSGVKASETTEREIDVAVRDIITKAFEQATAILRTRSADLDEGSRLLLARETLTADQFPAIRPATKQPETVG